MADEIEIVEEQEKKVSEKSKVPILLLLVLSLNFLVVFGIAFFIFYSKFIYKKPIITNKQIEEQIVDNVNQFPEFIEYKLEAFTVNLKKAKSNNYLNARFTLIAVDYETKGEIDKKVDVIRDKIIEVLNTKTPIELVSVQGKLFLKDQIVTEVNAILKHGSVKEVYIESFVIQ